MAVDQERHLRIVSMLLKEKLDAMVCVAPSDVLLTTGYWPVMGNSVVVFTADGNVQILLPEDEREIAAHSSDAALLTFRPASLEKLASTLEELSHPLVALWNKLALSHARVGMALGHSLEPASYAAMADFRSAIPNLLRQEFPKLAITPIDSQLEALKAVKTARELRAICKNCQAASDGFLAAPEAICEGLREATIAASIHLAFSRSPTALEMQRNYGFFYCMSGPNSAAASAAYARTRQRKVQNSDLVMIHANTCGDGYWSDITRTFTVGKPVENQAHMRAAILEAREAALDIIRPGIPAQQVDAAARSVLEKHGYGKQFKHALGHGVGFAAANPHSLPRIHPASGDVLEAGMTFNIEPAIYINGYGGMRHCDVVAVTARGVEMLTPFQLTQYATAGYPQNPYREIA